MFLPILSPTAGAILGIVLFIYFIGMLLKDTAKKIDVSLMDLKPVADSEDVNYSDTIEFEIDVKEVPGKYIIRNTFISKDLKFCCTLQNNLSGSCKTLKANSKASLEFDATIQIDVWKQAERAEYIMKG
mgnify:CR=1 FL=1